MKYNLSQFIGAFKIAMKAFLFKTTSPEELIQKAVEMADAARKGGFLALEEAKISNPFMQKGVDHSRTN
jgi:chemotaxis protein MotA